VNVLVVYAHPHPGSYAAALRDRAEAALRRAGHDVVLVDLWAERFEPRLSAEELRTHRQGIVARPSLRDHARRLQAAEALVFVYPTWWGGPPAMLKGWFDRVLCEGVAYTLPAGADRIRPRLGHIRHLVVVTTYGSSRWVNALQGEPGRRTIRWGVRTLLHRRVRTHWLALYRMDRNRHEDRRRFLDEVDARLSRLGT
jgi:putative NADPH-quinone reductase